MRKNRKRAAAVVLAATMTVGGQGFPVLTNTGTVAVEAAEQITTEDGFTIEGGTKLVSYSGSETAPKIPAGITQIGSKAFEGNKTITDIVIPDSVTQIGSRAFNGCTSLKTVTLSNQLEKLGESAFMECLMLTEIHIPRSLKESDCYSIYKNQGPFSMSGLKTITFEEGITNISDYLFAGCDKLTEIQIPDTVTTIGKGAFYGCTGLTRLEVPDLVTEIKPYAFGACSALADVKLSDALEKLGEGAFEKDTMLTAIEIPRSLKESDCYSIYKEQGPFYKSGLTTVTFEKGVSEITKYLFAGTTELKSVNIPDTVVTIGEGAFYASGLEQIKLGESVTKLENCAFANCTAATSLELNDCLEEIGGMAFGECSGLTSVHIPASLTKGNCYSIYDEKGAFYKSGLKEITFEEGTKVIADSLFASCEELESITIPNTVQVIGENAFYFCTALKQVNIPYSVSEIKNSAFDNCTSLTSIELTDNVDKVGERVFSDCSALKSVRLSNRMKVIPKQMFLKCSALESIDIPESVSEIKDYAFANCTSLSDVTMHNSVKRIGDQVFLNCGFTEYTLPSGVEKLGEGVFQENTKLTKIQLPDSLTYSERKLFYACESLEEVVFGTGLAKIPDGTFSDCSVLKKVVFPYGIKSIGTDVFHNCVSLTDVTIPKTVTELAEGMFSYPKRVTLHGVEGTEAQNYANNNKLKEFVPLSEHAQSLELSEERMVLRCGEERRLFVTINPIEFVDDVEFSSENSELVTVDEDGMLSAEEVGETVITVTAGDVSKTCTVVVIDSAQEETNTQKTIIEKGKAENAVVKGTGIEITFGEASVASDQALIVRAQQLGNSDDAESYKSADAWLKSDSSYNANRYTLYRVEMNNEATGEEVMLKNPVSMKVDVPRGMDAEKLVIVQMPEKEMSRAADMPEVIVPVVAEDGKTITFQTARFGEFIIVERTNVLAGDVTLDGVLDMDDAYAALKGALEIEELSEEQKNVADIDESGEVELSDVQEILKRALRLS